MLNGVPFLNYLGIYDRDMSGRKTKAENENIMTANMYTEQMFNYAMIRYEWLNLPDSFDERFMELVLNTQGAFVGYRQESTDKLVVSMVTQDGDLNMYYNPIKFRAYDPTGASVKLDLSTGVICYNNFTRTPTTNIINQYADRLSDITRTIDIDLGNQKHPIIYSGPKKLLLSIKNLFRNIRKNEPIIYTQQDIGQLTAINVQTEMVSDKLQTLKLSFWNEAMTMLGIENVNMEKRERLIKDEVNSNSEQIEMSRNMGLIARRDFCKRFNDMFGTDIWVRYRVHVDRTENELMTENPVTDIEEDITNG